MLDTSSRVYENFDKICDVFDRTYYTRAHEYWLVQETLLSGEISEAREDIAALIKDYEPATMPSNYWTELIDGEFQEL